MNTERSASLHARSSEVLPLGVSSGMRAFVTDPPLFFERAEGPYYYDVDGNKLLDYTLAWGPLILGSNHPQLNEAVTVALRKSYTLGAQHEGEIALAEKIVSLVPGAEQVIFSNTGSEAVQVSIRLSRAKTGRTAFLKFEGHYHGWMNNVLLSYHPDLSEAGPLESPNVLPGCGGQPSEEYAHTRILPWNRLDLLERELAKGDIAAVIMEPLNANSGSIEPADGFLQDVVDLCAKHGTVSIFDEVITGFRLALGGAREYFGVIPDLSIYAKALAGGFSLAAVAGKREMFDALRDGTTMHAGTYNGATINLAAGLATLEILSESPGLFKRMSDHGRTLRKTFEDEAKEQGITLSTSGAGTVFNVHPGQETAPTDYRGYAEVDLDSYTRFRRAMLDVGLQLLPDGRWYIGATHGPTELGIAQEAIRSTIGKLMA
jgi:glutamate-1-semialdehyde 2,1-aminomutase